MADRKRLADDLLPASFRDVPFQVETTTLQAGRRTQLHEYPQRDIPYVEDLGRATRDLNFTAFVIGDDYVDQANALLAALEEPGPGTLIHPWFGSLTVSLNSPASVGFDAALGVARFSLAFIESGELEFPGASASTPSQSRLAADSLETASVASFLSNYSVAGFQDFVAAAASGNLTAMISTIADSTVGKVLGYSDSLAATVNTAISLVTAPETLCWKVLGAFGLSGVATSVAAWSSIVRSLSRLGGSTSLAPPPAPLVYTPSRQQAYVNAVAVNALGRQAMIVQAVGLSSLVGTAADSTPQLSQTDMMAVRNELIAVIDQEALLAADDAYLALMDARSAVWADLTKRARDSARLTTLTPRETLPALVLAYDKYEDTARDNEIVKRNAVRHPGFVPPIALQVLSR